MSGWWPARRAVAALAVAVAVLTAAGAGVLGGSPLLVAGAGAYVASVLVALIAPTALVLPLVAGQVLAGGLLLVPGGPDLVALAPLVAGVVLTAELLGVAARLDAPIERSPGGDLGRSLVAATVGGGVFALVGFAGGLPGPGGIVAVGLASAACAALAVVMVRNAAGRGAER